MTLRLKKIFAFLLVYGASFTTLQASSCCNYVCDSTPYLCYADSGYAYDCGLFFGGQFLWWTVYQTNLDFAVDSARKVENMEEFPLILGPGKTHFLEHDWEGGWRAFGGFRFCDCWDFRGVYTRFIESAKGSAKACPQENLIATLTHSDTRPIRAKHAWGRLDLDYQVVDLLFSRPFKPAKTLILRPYFGARALFLDQKLKVNYAGREFAKREQDGGNDIEGLGGPGRVRWDSYYYGVGGNWGLETNLELDYGFKFFGDCSGSLVAGRTKQRHRQWMKEFKKQRVDLNEKQLMVLPGLYVASGLSWDTCFCDSAWLVIRASYELNLWFHTPQLRRYDGNNEGVSNGATAGSIGLHGGTFELRLLF